jgi:hypothetical protein
VTRTRRGWTSTCACWGRIDDLEAVVLDLLAKLKAQGCDARLDRRAP